MDLFGEKIYLANNFYTVTIDENSRVIDSCGLIAMHFRATYSNDTTYRVLQLWERAVLEFVNKHRPGMSDIVVYTTSEGLVSQEVRRTGMSAMPLMPLTFIFIMLFTVVTSLKTKATTSKPWEAVAGVFCPLIALVASFGLLFMLNFEFIPLLNVVPFLVLAIGVDDVFVTLHAWHLSDRSVSVARRVGETMADAGPSITITSLTNALSFGIGALSPTPAIRVFCIFAACTVTFGYIYQIFLFTAILALGGQREKNGTNAYCWWIAGSDKETKERTTTAESKGEELLSRFWDIIVELAMSWWTRLLIAVIMVAYWTFSILGVLQVRVGLSAEKLFLDDSPLHDFVRIQTETIFKEGGQMFVFVNKPGDLRNPAQFGKVMRMLNQFEHATGSIGPDSSHLWLQQYLPFVGFHTAAASDSFFNNEPVAFSYKYLLEFLKNRSYERWRYFLNLGTTEDCVNDKPSCVDRFFFTTGFKNASEWNYRLKLLLEWRAIAKEHADLEATVYEDFSMYTDQILSIGPATKQTVAMALICMALVCVVFIPHVISIVCATVSVLSINLGVFGGLTYWKVELDPISMATILMSIGFSVDYTAHISYHYYKGDAEV
uniref:SSD domain-containing protein n=2 Tax=Plectus sambesii TaxID=2011161 RepID=A0A914WW48_9BILA